MGIAAIAMVAVAAAAPPVPTALTAYIHDGRFDPGDYGWMRGAFDGATRAQQAAWRAIGDWRARCENARAAAIRADLAKRGVAQSKAIDVSGEALCADVAFAAGARERRISWADFQSALAQARPVAQAIIWSAALAQAVADPDDPTEASMLIARPMTDQVLRRSLIWNGGPIAGAPTLSEPALDVVRALVGIALIRRDQANTVWLKELVTKNGWPSIPKVGAEASIAAWLLVQHADDDPVFQLDMLRLMEPLASRNEVRRRGYAMLYDRVMLKIARKQRYASQMTCSGGKHVPLPLEDAKTADVSRAAMGMETIAANTARIDKLYGPCPPDVVPSPSSKR